MLRALLLLIALLCLAPRGLAQGGAFERVTLRVNSVEAGGRVVIDRGRSDGLREGDRVLFLPRSGGSFHGNVVQVEDRTAIVQLADSGSAIPTGTRGEARIPRSRFEPEPTPPRVKPHKDPQPPGTEGGTNAEVTGGAEQEPSTEHPEWENRDEEWLPDMPLLAQMKPLRPDQRSALVSGRTYVFGDATWASPNTRSDFFFRLGADARFENAFRKGGVLNLDFELNQRSTQLDDQPDENLGDFRLDRASYVQGGHRYSPSRLELGRFLQHGMPEFGLVDGIEYAWRLDNGNSFGGSAGFMPEPNRQLESGHDFQVSSFFRWVQDQTERLAVSTGVQKSWHDGTPDRELYVAKFDYVPEDTWHYHGTAFVDYYDGDDTAKGSGLELTQAWLTARRLYADGDSLDFTYRRLLFPELDRNEFLPVTLQQLANDHYDRVAATGWHRIHDELAVHAEAGLWVDEDDEGGDLAFGTRVEEVLLDDGRLELTGFGTLGAFSAFFGGRATFGQTRGLTGWNLTYELAVNDVADFAENADIILQHLVRGTYRLTTRSGWNLSLFAESLAYDREDSWSVGFYTQRSF